VLMPNTRSIETIEHSGPNQVLIRFTGFSPTSVRITMPQCLRRNQAEIFVPGASA
jgi:hypothetical protein